MRGITLLVVCILVAGTILQNQASAGSVCSGYGPQTPRDISDRDGSNPRTFAIAPSPESMNLCNIHFHVNAEHKGPGFSLSAGEGEHGGFRCNESDQLTMAQRQDNSGEHGGCHGVKPGDTIEIHWVYTSCDAQPGKGLSACLTEHCANPQLRVESQVFLVANDAAAADFASFAYAGHRVSGLYQPKALPTGTGEPVVFLGSTTGPKFNEEACSPMQVTWSVRPDCALVNVASLHHWCEKNVFEEDHAHGVRQIVTAPELLSSIK